MMLKHALFAVVFALAVAVVALAAPSAWAAAPTNDNFSDATVITAIPYTQDPALDPREATTQALDYSCFDGETTHSVWYKFTATANQRLRADTLGSNYDTVLCIYTGEPSAATLLMKNDDYPYNQAILQSMADFDVVANTTYYILAGSRTIAAGSILHFTLGEPYPIPTPTPSPTPTPPPVTLGVSINQTGQVTRSTGVAKVSGTMTCSQPVQVTLTVTLHQSSRGAVSAGSTQTQVQCNGSAVWSVSLTAQSGSFTTGDVDASAKVEGLGAQAQTTRTVKLQTK